MRKSRWLRSILAVLAFVLSTVATLLFFAQDRFLDSDDFGATAAASLADPDINSFLATEISDAIIDEAPSLATGGSLLRSVTSSVLESSAAQGATQTAVTEAHRTLFEDGSETFLIDVSDLVLMVDQTLQALVPDMAEAMPNEVGDIAVSISSGDLFTNTLGIAQDLRQLTGVVAVLAALALLAMILTDKSPWSGVSSVGLTLGTVGLLVLVLEVVGSVIAGSFFTAGIERNAVVALWELLLGELTTWAWVLIGAGAFLTGLAWAVLNVGHVRSAAMQTLSRLTEQPTSTWGRALRAGGAAAAAVWAIVDPLSLASLAIRALGFVAAISVVAEVVEATGLNKALVRAAPDETDVRSWRSAVTQVAIAASVIGMLGIIAAVVLSADDNHQAAADTCNGHVELCSRPYDQVVIAASHNSMSSTDTDFYLPNQTSTMIEQLDQGVRGLLIDTWYGRLDNEGGSMIVTDTDFVNTDALDPATKAAVDAARQRSNLGERSVYLCHSLCEIGALDAVQSLTEVAEWMERNPREVITVVVQDATTPEDTAAVFEQAGLSRYAHVQEFGEPFPTMEEMIESNRRLFVMVEEDGGDIEWLHQAFDFVQETPFSFSTVDDFTCDMNRGRADSPLFMVNHFITPAINNNRTINLVDVLRPRLEQCHEERGILPTVISADFVAYGDLITVVDELNGVAD